MPQMFHMIYEVRASPENPDYASAGGAFVNCFAYAEHAATAEWKALEYFKEHHWEVVYTEEGAMQTSRDKYKEQDFLDCYDEALDVGESYVFHLWPHSTLAKVRIYWKRLFS